MKQDLQWTQKIDPIQRTKINCNDRRHFGNKIETGPEIIVQKEENEQIIKNDIVTPNNDKQMTNKDDNDNEHTLKNYSNFESTKNLNYYNEKIQQNKNKDNITVNRIRYINTIKPYQSEKEFTGNSKVTNEDRHIGTISKTKYQKHEILDCKIYEKGKETNVECYVEQTQRWERQRKKCKEAEKKHDIFTCVTSTSRKKSNYNIRENFKIFFMLWMCIPAVHSYTIRGTIKDVTKLEEMKNEVNLINENRRGPNIDIDPLTQVGPNLTQTTACICPTTQQPAWGTSTATPTGTTTSLGKCLCPGDVQSLAEEETSTHMPSTGGKMRRRKDIEGMDLFVDNFDQKILKKMPFLKSY